ncbi:MAG TPA: winged helix-turn-helix domain-containing protein [Acidimicrobiales bacterium]|nr:winged helix-turn-helix domain-containing protein [Acidimicrobiales bacterium]
MGTDFAAVAGLLGHPARSTMVDALMGGDARTAGELARAAGIAPSTASEHLGRLIDGGLVAVVARGRHRYHRLRGPEVAAALEAFAAICPPTPVRSLRAASHRDALREGRTCYDHLAGRLGVVLTDALGARGWIVHHPAVDLTPAGEAALVAAGVDVAGARAARRVFARTCLDWTERRPHLAGALGAAVAAAALDAGWVQRRDGRSVTVTGRGREVLTGLFGIPPTALAGGRADPQPAGRG